MKIRTLKDLKEFLGTLNEQQLSQRAGLAVDDEYHYINSADFNEEAMVWNEDMIDGNIPVSEYNSDDFDENDLYDEKYNTIYPIGSIVILSAD